MTAFQGMSVGSFNRREPWQAFFGKEKQAYKQALSPLNRPRSATNAVFLDGAAT